ncbi:MAG: HAD family phosphatase [Flavobacteriales bacterium]|nr:HAD family phosphatase [Flavobacteriales bacterium]
MELKGIKNILFDLGGVLLNLDFELTKQAFLDLGVYNYEEYFTKAKQIGLFDSFETGKISEKEFCEQLRKLACISADNDAILSAWNAMLLDFPYQRKELVLILKKHYSTVLLSNTNETHIRAFTKIIKKDINEDSLTPLFNEVYYSNEIGLRKPSPEIFNYVLDQNNFLPEETLFLDDSIQHIAVAKKLGIQVVHIKETSVEELFANFLA